MSETAQFFMILGIALGTHFVVYLVFYLVTGEFPEPYRGDDPPGFDL